MWIKKKEYLKMKKKIDELQRDLNVANANNEFMSSRYNDAVNTCKSLEDDIKKKSSENIQLQRSVSAQIETNQKLNIWIEKMLNEVGIKELHERTGVTIPVYTNDTLPAYNFNPGEPMKRQEIIIPELRFIKMS